MKRYDYIAAGPYTGWPTTNRMQGEEGIESDTGNVAEFRGSQWVLTQVAGSGVSADSLKLSGNAQVTPLSTSGTAAQTAALTDGIYHVWAATNTFIKVAATANDVTTSTGYELKAGNTIAVMVPGGQKIGAVLASGSSTLYIHKVS